MTEKIHVEGTMFRENSSRKKLAGIAEGGSWPCSLMQAFQAFPSAPMPLRWQEGHGFAGTLLATTTVCLINARYI